MEEKNEFKPFELLEEALDDENDDGTKVLATLLSLPDESFATLAPNFLESFEEMMNIPETKLALVQGFNISGAKVEDLKAYYDDIIDEVDKIEDKNISEAKKDFLKTLMGYLINSIASTQGAATRIVVVPTELCHENAKMPQYAHVTDAGMDVYALDDYTIHPGETKLIPTGIKMAIPVGYEIQVRPKSGRAFKTKLRVANTPGTIDTGYRDEIGVIIENIEAPIKNISSHYENDKLIVDSIEYGSDFFIGKGEKFAQLVLNEVPKAVLHQVKVVAPLGENRNGGFGSSGLK